MSGLTSFQNDEIKSYIKSTFYDNSPNLIIMDFSGRCWALSETQFNNFYNPNTGQIYWDGKKNHYNSSDNNDYRKFGGWKKDSGDCMWRGGCGLSGLLDMNNSQGYSSNTNSNVYPSKDANGSNYYKKDDKSKFDTNRKNRLFTWNGNSPPNAIQGYYRVSRNNADVNCPNYFLKDSSGSFIQFPNAGFVTMVRSGTYYDIAFILFAKYLNRDDFANDIMTSNSIIVSKILNEQYGLNKIRQCMTYVETPNHNLDWTYTPSKNLQLDSTGRCLDGDGTNLYGGNCASDNTYQQWLKNGNNIQHVASGKCLDSGGNNVYFSNCDSNNTFQSWTFDGNKILHANSGKCLNFDSSGTLTLADCSCKIELDNNKNNFRYKYEDYLTQQQSICNTKSDFGYDLIDTCGSLLSNVDNIGSKYVEWCTNGDDTYQYDQCMTQLINNDRYYDLYVQRQCSTGDNIVNHKLCSGYLRKKIDDPHRYLYNKITRDNILAQWCQNNKHESCDYLTSRKDAINSTLYNSVNETWKKYNCGSDLPLLVFIRIMNLPPDDQLSYLKNEFFTKKTMFARNVCYTGEALEAGQSLLPMQCLYSQDKSYKVCLLPNGDFRRYKTSDNTSISLINKTKKNNPILLMQLDGNLVCYDGTNDPYWASNTYGADVFAVIQNDGRFVIYDNNSSIIKDLTKSNFDNNSIETEFHTPCIINIIIIFILFIFVGIILKITYFTTSSIVVSPNQEPKIDTMLN